MPDSQDRKHKILHTKPESIDTSNKYRTWFGGKPEPIDEEDTEEEDVQDQIIYDRWKSPIQNSISNFNTKFSEKFKKKKEVIAEFKITKEVYEKQFSIYEYNRIDIFFYKILSPSQGELYIDYFQKVLNLQSFKFIKKDFNNTCISCLLNYEDSKQLLKNFNIILNKTKRNEVDEKFHSLRLVKQFKIIDVSEKLKLSTIIDKDTFNVFIPHYKTVDKNIVEIWSIFNLIISDIINTSSGSYLSIRWEYTNLQKFLLFFEIPEYVFSSVLRTRIFSDDNSPAVTNKELKKPNIINTNIPHLPVVFLFDSWFPADRSVVNDLIEPLVVDQKTIPSLEKENTFRDHAVQMAGIIVYGEILNNVQNYDSFIEWELTPYARLYSILVWADKPRIWIHSLPEIFDEVISDKIVKDQRIKIFNMSWNIELPKQENENINFLSYTLDKYLFFHPEILAINSVWNYEWSKDNNFFTYPNNNINVPSDALNILSIWSFWIDESKNIYIANGTSKNQYDKWSIKNNLVWQSNIDSVRKIQRSENYYTKPDLLWLWEKWTSTTQSILTLLKDSSNWTSHATAYISHLSSKILLLYPELKYALSVENILLKFANNYEKINYEINPEEPIYESINDRINDLLEKTTFDKEKILEYENRAIHKRYIWWWVADISNIFYNKERTKTFIIEWEIWIGDLQYHRINILDHISKDILESNDIWIDWHISFRAIPCLEDSLWYNMINIIWWVWFASDYEKDGKFKHENIKNSVWKKKPSPIKWSSNQMCKDRIRYPRNHIEQITTKTDVFKQLFTSNNGNVDVIVKSLLWRKRENEVKDFFKDYFDWIWPDWCVDFLKDTYNLYVKSKNIDLSLVKIPYSIIISVEVKANIDIYDTIEVTSQVDL